MRNRRVRRFRHRSSDRMHQSRSNGDDKHRIRPQTFSNGRMRNFKPQQSAEKLVEKYNLLAKEALSSGDKVLSENYYQHADHFTRIVVEKDIHRKQNAAQNIQEDQKKETKTSTLDQNSLSENTDNDNKK